MFVFFLFCPSWSRTKFSKAVVIDVQGKTAWDSKTLRLGVNLLSIAIRQIGKNITDF